MIEYAIPAVMVIFAIGFAWMWFISKRKSEREKKRSAKGDRTIICEGDHADQGALRNDRRRNRRLRFPLGQCR